MKYLIICVLVVTCTVGASCANVPTEIVTQEQGSSVATEVQETVDTSVSLELTSTAFEHNQMIPLQYTCDGDGIHPDLQFSNTPKKTKSFALIVYDPDVPETIREDQNWDHWLVWNISPTVDGIAEGAAPEAVLGTTTGGTQEFVPPCAPDTEHRYIFTLYALDTMLELEAGATRQELEKEMKGHIIEHSELIGVYNRQ